MVARRQSTPRGDSDGTTACVADGLSKIYGRRDTAVQALRDVTLQIPGGEFTAIMGPSGSGKSTLLHCLAALDTPTSGRVFLGTTELTALSRRQQAQVRRDRIGFVFQAFNLVPTLDAIENITLPQLLAGRRPDQQWLDYVVAQIGLGDRLHHRPSELSGGQQQRVALARALAGRPEVIFADEPTGNLDTTASAEMLRLLRDAVDQFDQTVVVVTHDPTIAAHADRILFFTDGRVVDETDQPDVDSVLARTRHLDGTGGDSGNGHMPERSDGQDTMRSRRRRQPDEQTPGRPMVGSDDEIEVARQERWLQRIRQQFDAEQPPTPDTDDRGPARETLASAPPTAQHTHDAQHTNGRPDRDDRQDLDDRQDRDDRHDRDDRQVEAAAPDRTHDAAGWLPPERSWSDLATGHDSAVDDRDTQPAEPVPWSRPHADHDPEPEPTPPTATDGRDVESDPWAPPDRTRAEEYHSGAGGARRSRSGRGGDDVWTTSPPWTRRQAQGDEAAAADDAAETDGDAAEHQHREPPAWRPPHSPDDTDPHNPPAWQQPEHADEHDDRQPDPHNPPAWQQPEHADEHDDRQPAADTDPWSAVWDANLGADVAEVWTPAFDAGLPAFDTDIPAPPITAADDADATDVPAYGKGHQSTPADTDDAVEPPADADDDAADPPADADDDAPSPLDTDTATHTNGHRPTPTHDDDTAAVPAALASLRSARRPDQPPDPLDALQSLQAQLERLGSGRRSGRPRPPRSTPRDSGADTDRRERR